MRSPRRSGTAYPMARVLYPAARFHAKKREQIFRQIKNNDWDAVILSHEQFGMIPQSPEIQQEIFAGGTRQRRTEPYAAQGARQERIETYADLATSSASTIWRPNCKRFSTPSTTARTMRWTSAVWVSTTSAWTRATNSKI